MHGSQGLQGYLAEKRLDVNAGASVERKAGNRKFKLVSQEQIHILWGLNLI